MQSLNQSLYKKIQTEKQKQCCSYLEIPGTLSITDNHIFKTYCIYSSLYTGDTSMSTFTFLFAVLKMPANTFKKYILYQEFIRFIKWQVFLNFVSKKETSGIFHIKGFIPLWNKNANYLLLQKTSIKHFSSYYFPQE